MARACAAGIDILSVTDHDTVLGYTAAAREAGARGLEIVAGIEITSALDGADVHLLGYFIDTRHARLLAFLAEQRQLRIDRVREIIARLGALGVDLDAEAVLAPAVANASKAAGRPWIARALVDAGWVATVSEAFERWLGRGGPAFVPRVGVPPSTVFARVKEAGGVTSLAHPGLTRCDDHIPRMVEEGLDAIEVYHSKHDAETTARYLTLAARLGVLITGGSDYHGDLAHNTAVLGAVSLPRDAFDRLAAKAR